MKTLYIPAILFMLIVFLGGCSSGSEDTSSTAADDTTRLEIIQDREQHFLDLVNNQPGSADLRPTARQLVEDYRQFADFHPDHEQTPEMLFRAANMRADALHEYTLAIGLFERIRRDYPESEQAKRSLFLIAYTQAEMMNDYDSARKTYEAFIKQYPDSELADAARSELQYLGKDIDEIIRSFED